MYKNIEKEKRFQKWVMPEIKHGIPTKYGWIVSHPENLVLGWGVDIGAFSYLQAKEGIKIGKYTQIGGGVKIYSISTIDNRSSAITIGKNCKIGANSVIMPGVIIEDNSIIGALSFIKYKMQIPPNEIWAGVPVKKIRNLKTTGDK